MPKHDLKKNYAQFYAARRNQATFVTIPHLLYLSVDGSGHPTEETYQQAAMSIYTLAYTLKFMLRAENQEWDYTVMPMQTQWMVDRQRYGNFNWTMRILQPEWITSEWFEAARRIAQERKPALNLDAVRLENLIEGPCVQTLHVGPYENMNDTLANLTLWAEQAGYRAATDTHDIYLNDVRKTRPENLKAIMRIQIYPQQ